MQKLLIILIFLVIAALAYLLWREYQNGKIYEAAYRTTFQMADSLRTEIDSLKIKRQRIKSFSVSIKQREKERKNEAANLNSIDSLARLANSLLAGKGS